MAIKTGSTPHYLWLESHQDDIHSFLEGCSDVLMGRYLAITSNDSGTYSPSPDQLTAGWRVAGEILDSPILHSHQELTNVSQGFNKCGSFHEFYTFQSKPNLGEIFHGNIFEAGVRPHHLKSFVNFLGFRISDPVMKDVTTLFWKQMDWIQPQAYVADTQNGLVFATSDKALFTEVYNSLASAILELHQ